MPRNSLMVMDEVLVSPDPRHIVDVNRERERTLLAASLDFQEFSDGSSAIATNSPATESTWGQSSLEEILSSYRQRLLQPPPPELRTHTGRRMPEVESEGDHVTLRYMEGSRRRDLSLVSRYLGPAYGAQEVRVRVAMELGSWDLDPDVAKTMRELVDAPSRDTLVRVPAPVIEPDATPRAALAVEAEALLGYKPLRVAVKAPGALRAVLAKLEIEVLDEASVNAYKAQMVQHYDTHKKMSVPTWRLTELSKYTQPVPEFVLRKACDIKRELPTAIFYIDQLAVDPFLLVSTTPITDFLTNQVRKLDLETQAYVEVWDEPKFEETL